MHWPRCLRKALPCNLNRDSPQESRPIPYGIPSAGSGLDLTTRREIKTWERYKL